jgi:hypothetical protein
MTLAPPAPASPAPASAEHTGTRPQAQRRWLRALGEHWLFLLFLVIGVAIRLLTMATYSPAFMFFGDSYAYTVAAQRFEPPTDRPFGYAAILRLLSTMGDVPLVVAVQHLVGVALAVALYVVLLRRGARPWIAALAAAPLLLDAYLIQIEHNLLTESIFAALLASAVFVATRRDLTWASAAVAGGLLAAAASTRTVAIPIAALFLGYFLVRRIGWRPLLAFVAALVVPILAYMTWFASVHGIFATTDASGRFLYGRVAVFADCEGLDLTRNEAKLCDNADPALRPNANFYVWSSDSPLQSLDLSGPATDKVAATFSRKVILDQPLTYARYAITDAAHYFAPWRFPLTAATPNGSTSVGHNDLQGNPVTPVVDRQGALLLSSYQTIVFTHGPILIGALLLGLAAGVLDRGRRRFDGPFVALVGLAVVVIPSLTVMFDYRYGMPAIPLLMYAGGIGGVALHERVLARRAQRIADDATVPADEPVDLTATGTELGARADVEDVAPDAIGTPRPPWRRRAAISALAITAIVLVSISPLQRNATFARYVSMHAELGTLGAPLDAAQIDPTNPDVTVQRFTTGTIVERNEYAVVVPTRYVSTVERFGGYGELGMPTNREQPSPYRSADRYLPLEEGVIFWSRLDGTRTITGTIFDVWNPRSVQEELREPVADAVRDDDGTVRQQFDGGAVTVAPNGSIRIDLDDEDDESTSTTTERSSGDSAVPSA